MRFFFIPKVEVNKDINVFSTVIADKYKMMVLKSLCLGSWKGQICSDMDMPI